MQWRDLKKNIDESRNLNFQNLIFSHFVRLNIAIKRIPHIFRGWVPEMFVTSYSVTYCMYIPGNRDFVSITIVQFMSSNIIRLFVHNTISLSSLCKLIWRHWTYKMPVRYILSSVWVRLSIFSQLSIIQYMGMCVFSLPISLVMIEMIYTLSYYHHQIGSMNYYPCLGLGHETMVCAVCLYSYCIISEIANIIAVIRLLQHQK